MQNVFEHPQLIPHKALGYIIFLRYIHMYGSLHRPFAKKIHNQINVLRMNASSFRFRPDIVYDSVQLRKKRNLFCLKRKKKFFHYEILHRVHVRQISQLFLLNIKYGEVLDRMRKGITRSWKAFLFTYFLFFCWIIFIISTFDFSISFRHVNWWKIYYKQKKKKKRNTWILIDNWFTPFILENNSISILKYTLSEVNNWSDLSLIKTLIVASI